MIELLVVVVRLDVDDEEVVEDEVVDWDEELDDDELDVDDELDDDELEL